MKFLAVYFAVVCIVSTIYSINGQKVYVMQPTAAPAQKPVPKLNPTGNHIPEYDDQFPDFPQSPEEALSEIFNSAPMIPLWIVNPFYYIFEITARGIAYMMNPY
uniref:Uncharacterized protein n=1 Tax=Trichobilharzia regenti TaxID=157069 RepID=A0AA85JQH4_TRIRE|nr:unnamed protein product [Trichobilharzia regenti]